jgi:cation:H+ antiporter
MRGWEIPAPCGLQSSRGALSRKREDGRSTKNVYCNLQKGIQMVLLEFVIGLLLLVYGADRFVAGALSLAKRAGISPLVIGLTIFALGTSFPELTVSVMSAFQGKADIAVGNVVGSNICNILLILGITGLVTPLAVQRRVFCFDAPVMLGVALAVTLLGLDGELSRLDGLLLVAGLAAYLAGSVLVGKKSGEQTELEIKDRTPAVILGLVVLGLLLMVGGSQLMVQSAVKLALSLGASEAFIGLTIVAIGTSLPELAASIVAARKGQADLAVGNVVGSNILNILAILGASAIISPRAIQISSEIMHRDIPVMVAASALVLPFFWTFSTVTRSSAAVLAFGYLLYVAYLLAQLEGASRTPLALCILVVWAIAAAVILAREIREHLRNNRPAAT